MQVIPFTVPHDAREPVQFVLSDGERKLGVLTDIGVPTAHVAQMLSGLDALVLECNYDRDMLWAGATRSGSSSASPALSAIWTTRIRRGCSRALDCSKSEAHRRRAPLAAEQPARDRAGDARAHAELRGELDRPRYAGRGLRLARGLKAKKGVRTIFR